ncbi:MAG: beta/gamma crystallin family protein [Opitutae bacterium]|nr:beta/gamma crystallin family protein [Opitutae bacterium]
MNCRFVFLLLALAGVVPAARADHRDEESRHRGSRVVLYEKAGYRGDSLTLFAGEAVENLDRVSFDGGRRANDRISSIRIEGGAVLLAYEHARFRGQLIRVTESIPNLADRALPEVVGSWNDRISSLQAEAGGRAHGDHRHGDRRAPPDGADYERIIARAYDDVLRREPDAEGLRYFRGLMIDQGWTEQMVRAHIRKSAEYRGPVINRMIERAYQDLLGRSVDPSGLDHYRNLLLDHGLTEQGMRDDLRRSAEFRQRSQPPAPAPQTPPRGDDKPRHDGAEVQR